jgi:hypothetical protein
MKLRSFVFKKVQHWQCPQISTHAVNIIKHRFAHSLGVGCGLFKSAYYAVRYPYI